MGGLQAAPEGKKLCENLHFLGGFGVREIDGLTVAYLSGRYDAKVSQFIMGKFSDRLDQLLISGILDPGLVVGCYR